MSLTEITGHVDHDCLSIDATITQDCNQYDNLFLKLARVMQPTADLYRGDIVLIEPEQTYALVGDDIALLAKIGPQAYLRDKADDWAIQTDDSQIEKYNWGLKSATDDAVDADYSDTVIVLREGNFYGYTPRRWVIIQDVLESQDGETGNYTGDEPPFEWANAEAALAWIDEQYSGPYCCSNGEAGAPTYYVIAV